MPMSHVTKSHHLQAFALSTVSSVGIASRSAYDLVLEPYRG
jgi:hypothetical protein